MWKIIDVDKDLTYLKLYPSFIDGGASIAGAKHLDRVGELARIGGRKCVM